MRFSDHFQGGLSVMPSLPFVRSMAFPGPFLSLLRVHVQDAIDAS